ncbi:MAG: cyanophycin synthetase [Lentisphaeria bacterium]|jgi:dihydrofolate synthase/folylpolyglutamate synthase|nr:cyanophycin synthetase [Lentisphaeria bacterium]
MRDWDQGREAAFFDLLSRYLDLERDTSRSYAAGEYSLERMPLLARLAGNPEQQLGIVHVAGTKGKGSTCHFLTCLLVAAGQRLGTFASPHLSTVRERFLIDGGLIDYAPLLDQTRELAAKIEATGMAPGFFEILTVLGLQLFVRAGCRLAVVETGIGGRLDATNYIQKPLCTAITPVSFDHMQILGNTIEEIAAEKAGILKPGVPLVLAKQPFPAAEQVILDRACELGVPVERPVPLAEARSWLPAETPEFLLENFTTSLRVCQLLGYQPKPADFRMPELRGRFEIIQRDPLVLLDAAHNADSARRLAEAVRQRFPGQSWTVVVGVAKGKDVPGIVRELAAIDGEFVLTNPRPPKASGLADLVAAAKESGIRYRVIDQIQTPADLPGGRPLLFTGSFFAALIGEELFSHR